MAASYRDRSVSNRLSKSPSVLSGLRRRIVLNELVPGTALTELQLAAEFGCSQAAVREALLRLDGEGLVLRSGRRGTVVTDLDMETALEMLALRRRIELRGARRAARRAGAGDIARLRALLDAMHGAAESGEEWSLVEADTEFHLALFRAAGLPAMEPILMRCILHTHRFKLWAPWHRRSLAANAVRHQPILAALCAGDAAALVRSLAAHLDTIVEEKTARVA
jgi:DNA-binding GntR family transcriptional regulator